jgi:signal-transduction protein with cAMP-binding, CBS, and nucleotidyltransferase domain
MKIERICTRSIVGTSRHDTIEDAAAAMHRFHVGALLVFEKTDAGQEVVGIVTDRDLVLRSLADRLNAHKVAVEKVMTPVVASVALEADTLEAVDRMRAAGVRRLLVTDAHGDPAGLVSLDDIVDGLAAELAAAAALMKAELHREAADLAGPRAAASVR